MVWGLLLILAGILFSKTRAAKKLILSGVIVLLLFSNPLLFRWAASAWEQPLQHPDTMASTPEVMVVLGGMSAFEKESNRVIFSASADRLLQALDLSGRGHAKRIVISGGAANILTAQKPEAEYLRDYLLRLGYADSLLFAETGSKNTAQNAENTAALFQRKGWPKNIILVTSAFHLYRAIRCFEKQGFTVSGYGTDPLRNYEPLTPADVLIPGAGILDKWNLLIKEWLGVLTYKMMDYI